jgi:hypothetical protein
VPQRNKHFLLCVCLCLCLCLSLSLYLQYFWLYFYRCLYFYVYLYLYLDLPIYCSFFLSISIDLSIYLYTYVDQGFLFKLQWNSGIEGNPKGTPREPQRKPEGFRKYHHIITSDFCLLRRSWISQAGAALLFHNKKDTTDENPIGWMNTQVWPPIFDRRPSWPLVRHSIERWSKGEWPPNSIRNWPSWWNFHFLPGSLNLSEHTSWKIDRIILN